MKQEPDWRAFEIIERIGNELDITFGATRYPWKCYLTTHSYDILKTHPGTYREKTEAGGQAEYVPAEYIYWKDGWEYVKLFDNHNIPFVIHARIAGFKDQNSLELDDLNDPNIQREYHQDWNTHTHFNPEQAPQHHPSLKVVPPKREFKQEVRQLMLWNEIGSESNPNRSKE